MKSVELQETPERSAAEQPRLFEIVLPGPTKLLVPPVKNNSTLEEILGTVDYVETFLIRRNKEFSYYSVTNKSKEPLFTAVLDSSDIRAPMLILNRNHQPIIEVKVQDGNTQLDWLNKKFSSLAAYCSQFMSIDITARNIQSGRVLGHVRRKFGRNHNNYMIQDGSNKIHFVIIPPSKDDMGHYDSSVKGAPFSLIDVTGPTNSTRDRRVGEISKYLPDEAFSIAPFMARSILQAPMLKSIVLSRLKMDFPIKTSPGIKATLIAGMFHIFQYHLSNPLGLDETRAPIMASSGFKVSPKGDGEFRHYLINTKAIE